MKKITNWLFCLAFLLCLILPALNMELGRNIESSIDNAYLPELEFTSIADVNDVVSAYLEKRIGFRKEALDIYQNINQRLFGIMEHPSYMYGEEGQVFYKLDSFVKNFQHLNLDQAKIDTFADSISGFSSYAGSRDMTFLYFLLPDKETVYPEFYPREVNVLGDVSRSDLLIEALEDRGVSCYFARETMQQAKKELPVNNVKYDAGHWNHHGTFACIQHLYTILQERFPQIEPLERDEFHVGYTVMESLQTSYFEINEKVPLYSLKETSAIDKTDEFCERVKIYFPKNHVCHWENPACADQPKLLIFGDSYLADEDMFFINHFSEYTYIHRYNLYNQKFFEYYVDQVEPDIVIFENPERSLIIDLNKPMELE